MQPFIRTIGVTTCTGVSLLLHLLALWLNAPNGLLTRDPLVGVVLGKVQPEGLERPPIRRR